MTPSGEPSAERCSLTSAGLGETMVGTAPEAAGWVALEQNGPWGRSALTSSHLDPGLGALIEERCAEHGLRPCLVRRPGRHADSGGDGLRTLLVAHAGPRRSWLLRGAVEDPRELLDLDLGSVRDGDREAVLASLPSLSVADEVHLLVCTNGTRDLCCAFAGRPVAEAAGRLHPDQVWETTHTSGHRFAATAVILPTGYLHGRLDSSKAVQVLAAAERGETELASARGRSCWSPDEQVAEHAVRSRTGDLRVDTLAVERVGGSAAGRGEIVVTHTDGRRWRVTTRVTERAEVRPPSCGKSPEGMSQITAVMVQPEQTSR